MKILTNASFYGTGSSAVTDLFSEYEGVRSYNDYEIRFLHDPDGISDLEFSLVECHNRHSSGFALKRFMRLVNFLSDDPKQRYEACFNGYFHSLAKEYIDSLVDFRYRGWWFYDAYDGRGFIRFYFCMLFRKFIRFVSNKNLDIFPSEFTYCSHPTPEKFLRETQAFVQKLCLAANPGSLPFVSFDQIVSSQNISRILRYFLDEVFVFVVYRDPRDLFLCSKYFWKERIIPFNDVHSFCKWYRYTLESGSPENGDLSHVKRIHFEDLIYRYDESVKEIEDFVGLKECNHTKQFSLFNPLKSVVNTRLWERYGTPEEMAIIESELSEYLYDFDAVKSNKISGIPMAKCSVF